jgi:hypothetical protein
LLVKFMGLRLNGGPCVFRSAGGGPRGGGAGGGLCGAAAGSRSCGGVRGSADTSPCCFSRLAGRLAAGAAGHGGGGGGRGRLPACLVQAGGGRCPTATVA